MYVWKVTSISLLMNPLLKVLSQQITEVLHWHRQRGLKIKEGCRDGRRMRNLFFKVFAFENQGRCKSVCTE